jgi:hypothetical protein
MGSGAHHALVEMIAMPLGLHVSTIPYIRADYFANIAALIGALTSAYLENASFDNGHLPTTRSLLRLGIK